MSLTCHEEIGRVGSLGRGYYEDTRENARNMSYVSCPWNLENDTTHGQTEQHYIVADRRPTNQVNAWQAEWGSHGDRHEETAFVEFKLNDSEQVAHTRLYQRRQSSLLYVIVKPGTFSLPFVSHH